MNTPHQQRNEALNRLNLRAERMQRIVRQDPPDLLAVKEALLILSAAAELSPEETKRELAAWLAANPKVAPDGGALFDLRCAAVDECAAFLIEQGAEGGGDSVMSDSWAEAVAEDMASTLKVPPGEAAKVIPMVKR